MTKVEVLKKQEIIRSIQVSGHAFFAKSGQDIVCAGISTLCYTFGNKLLDLEEENVVVEIIEGFFKISITLDNRNNQLLLQTLVLGLRMIEEKYYQQIKIKEVDDV